MCCSFLCVSIWSPSTRRAWIEIQELSDWLLDALVALHPEGVDRNNMVLHMDEATPQVALHPEGVDRN